MTLNLTVTQQTHTDFTPRITVIGVGGGGTNAVDNMIALDLQGVDFVVANTDAQQLQHSRAHRRIQLGPHITQGLGAGAKPEIGRAAAEEASEELIRHLDGAHMVFITAGMGGGTGTGAAPVIARMARERNILTVGVVTKPFAFEGVRRARSAELGIEELQHYVDTLIVIPNQNLFRIANEKTTWKDAFKMADHVLYMGVRGVTDLMMTPGQVNLDFADIRTVMAEMGKAMMGTGEAEGDNRAIRAAEAAISNPLLEDTSMSGARGLLINITGGEDMTLFEVDQAANRIREEVDEEANIIFGSAIDPNLNGRVRVSVVATGIDVAAQHAEAQRPRLVAVGGGAPVPVQGVQLQAGPMSGGPIAGQVGGQMGGQMGGHGGGGHGGGGHGGGGHGGGGAIHAQASAPQPTLLAPSSAPGAPVLAHAVPLTATGGMHYPTHGAAAHQAAYAAAAAPVPLRAVEPEPEPQPAAQHHPQAQPAARPPRGGLFAPEPGHAEQGSASPVQAAPEPPRRNIFQAVTGRLRNTLAAAGPSVASPAATRHEPVLHEREAAPQASVQQTGSEEMGLDIPAFLRRQSS